VACLGPAVSVTVKCKHPYGNSDIPGCRVAALQEVLQLRIASDGVVDGFRLQAPCVVVRGLRVPDSLQFNIEDPKEVRHCPRPSRPVGQPAFSMCIPLHVRAGDFQMHNMYVWCVCLPPSLSLFLAVPWGCVWRLVSSRVCQRTQHMEKEIGMEVDRGSAQLQAQYDAVVFTSLSRWCGSQQGWVT
jgi:hypothetical protein